MKKIYLILLLSLVSINLFAQIDLTKKPEPLAEKEFVFPNYITGSLDNGMKLFVVEDDEQPVISFSLYIPGGNCVDGDKPGLAEITATLMTKGTKNKSALEIAEILDGIGANISVNSSTEIITIYGSCLKKHFQTVLDLFTEILTEPVFPQEELDKLKPQLITGLKSEKSNSGAIGKKLALKITFGEKHPYAQQMSEASIEKITIEDVKDYYNKYYRPNNATLAVVGEISQKDVKSMFNKAFKNWQKGTVPAINIPKPSPLPMGVYFVERKGSVQSSVGMAYQTLPINNKETDIVDIATNLISKGSSSRLYKTLREEKSYTYGPRGGHSSYKNGGLYYCYADVRNSVTDSAVNIILEQISTLYKGTPGTPNDDEVKLTKQVEIGGYLRNFESSEFIASLIQSQDFYGMPMEQLKTYPNRIEAITKYDVKNAAEKYLNTKKGFVVVVGSAEVKEKLAQFGKIYEYDLDIEPMTGEKAKMEKVSFDAKELLEKYTEAIGGNSNIEKIKTLAYDGKIELSSGGRKLPGKAIMKQKAPNKQYQLIDLGVMKNEMWVDGTNAWATEGPGKISKIEGDNAAQMLNDAAIFQTNKLIQLGYKCEVLGKQANAILMKVVGVGGKEKVYYFNAQNYLLDKIESNEDAGPQGTITVTESYSEYVDVQGVKLPNKINVENPMFTIVTTCTYSVNQDIDDAAFNPPPAPPAPKN